MNNNNKSEFIDILLEFQKEVYNKIGVENEWINILIGRLRDA